VKQETKHISQLRQGKWLEVQHRLKREQLKLRYAETIFVIIGTLASVLASVVSFGISINKIQSLRILAIAVGAITTVIIFAVLLWIAKRRSSFGKNITILLQSTFLEALDDSNVNPRRPVGEKHAE
jgi:hypothetical protein